MYPDKMTELPWLMFILTFISTFQWPNSLAEHNHFVLYNNSHWEENIWTMDNETTTTTYNEDQKNVPVPSIENIRVIVSSTVNLTNSSSIVIPTLTGEKIKINSFIPAQNAIEKCKLNESYCIKIDNYPREDLSYLIRTSKFVLNPYYDIDAMNEINDFETRILDDSLESFCESKVKVIFPEAGLTSKNEWRYIIQTPEINDNGTFIKQGILVEKCIDTRVPCKFDDTLPLGYVSTCIQKYILKRLISIGGSHHFYYDSFKMPSCCQCMYSRIDY
ncbi:protein spaetzle-like [Metopolophium dirhodum]|uniref:protein spaetzle-like n=1 Tax=Metopolophium dirhodum TaxID=44670 RepID=UPI0029900950|nr:protein spaetzle-like [Metopolophium dirhodum]